MLSLSIGLAHKMSHKLSISLVIGGATESIFWEAETLLLSSTDYWEALQYVASKRDMNKYRSVMDFLFIETHPEWREHCFRFYRDKGPALRYDITPEQRFQGSCDLVATLAVAHAKWMNGLLISWGQLTEEASQVSTLLQEAA